MGNSVANYSFTIIEDGQVPLAGSFDTVSYTPIVAIVVICLMIAALCGYVFWILAHSKRIAMQGNMSVAEIVSNYFFNPLGLLRDETATEYALLEGSLSN